MPATVSVEADKPETPKPAPARARKIRRKVDAHRWVRETRGILAVAVAGFAIVSLGVFDPALPLREQATSVGPVGWWLGWALFRALGYAGFLMPLLVGAWGVSAFVRPKIARGWVPLAGLGVLLLAAAGLLQQAADTFVAERITRGGILATGGWLGWVVTGALHATLGRFGAWLVLLAAVPVAVLLVTQASYAAIARLTAARVARFRRARQMARVNTPKLVLDPVVAPAIAVSPLSDAVEAVEPPLPVVVEPA
jgi:DNA segregation ATPase FtsK/SpoIIIE-like protein